MTNASPNDPQLLGVRLSVPDGCLLLPRHNSVASPILAECLLNALGGKQIDGTDPLAFGELNQFTGLFFVDCDRATGLRNLEQCLVKFNLRVFATVLYYDTRECIFRAYGPNHANVQFDFTFESLKESSRIYLAEVKAYTETLVALSNSFRPQP